MFLYAIDAYCWVRKEAVSLFLFPCPRVYFLYPYTQHHMPIQKAPCSLYTQANATNMSTMFPEQVIHTESSPSHLTRDHPELLTFTISSYFHIFILNKCKRDRVLFRFSDFTTSMHAGMEVSFILRQRMWSEVISSRNKGLDDY